MENTMVERGELLYQGKAKSLYKTADPDVLLVEFRDDTTAFDGAKKEALALKGQVNNAISHFIMEHLQKNGVPTAVVKQLSATECLVKRLEMMPVECVIRNVAAGSLCRRLGAAQGMMFKPALFELFYKNDELHDPLINANHAVTFGWATREQLVEMERLTHLINDLLSSLFSQADLILVDAKFEFGIVNGEVVLGDEISPDSCRIWDAQTNEPLDKDRFRHDMGNVIGSYQEIARRLGVALAE